MLTCAALVLSLSATPAPADPSSVIAGLSRRRSGRRRRRTRWLSRRRQCRRNGRLRREVLLRWRPLLEVLGHPVHLKKEATICTKPRLESANLLRGHGAVRRHNNVLVAVLMPSNPEATLPHNLLQAREDARVLAHPELGECFAHLGVHVRPCIEQYPA